MFIWFSNPEGKPEELESTPMVISPQLVTKRYMFFIITFVTKFTKQFGQILRLYKLISTMISIILKFKIFHFLSKQV